MEPNEPRCLKKLEQLHVGLVSRCLEDLKPCFVKDVYIKGRGLGTLRGSMRERDGNRSVSTALEQ